MAPSEGLAEHAWVDLLVGRPRLTIVLASDEPPVCDPRPWLHRPLPAELSTLSRNESSLITSSRIRAWPN